MSSIVYGLLDPRDKELRYVGCTKQRLNLRLGQHINEAQKKNVNHRTHWIKSLLSKGLRPMIVTLVDYSIVAHSEFLEAEKFWIRHYRAIGYKLTNGTDGGGGTLGWKPDEAWRQKRRAFMIGKRYSLGINPSKETRKKMSVNHIGKTTGKHSSERVLKNSRSQGGRSFVDEAGNVYQTVAEASRKFNYNRSYITAVLKGRRNHHHGHTFHYLVGEKNGL